MDRTPEKNWLSRGFVAILVILGGAGSWSIARTIVIGDDLSGSERVWLTVVLISVVIGIVTVIVQRLQLRKQETFRREKW